MAIAYFATFHNYVVTGSQEHYQAVRAAVVAHMPVIPNLFTTSDVASVQQYLNLNGMAANGTWGNRQEVSVLCHLLHTPVDAYDTATNQWEEMTPGTYSNPPIYVLLGLKLFTLST